MDSLNLTRPVTAAVAAVAVAAAVAFVRQRRQVPKADGAPPRRLRASSLGTTKLMVTGSYDVEGYDTIINVAARFDGGLPDTAAFADLFLAHAAPHMRFSCVPMQEKPLGEVFWTPRAIDRAHHFLDVATEDEADTRRAVDAIVDTVLADKDRPWWEAHLLRERNGGGGTLLLRMHHAIGDGISIVQALAPCMTDAAGAAVDLEHLFKQRSFRAPVDKNASIVSSVLLKPLAKVVDVVRSLAKVIAVSTMGGDTKTRFTRFSLPVGDHVTVYLPTHRLATIKAIKNAAGAATTVNDVEFALFAGMVRRFELEHDGAVNIDTAQMRAMTPLALPEDVCEATRHSTLLRNYWSFLCNRIPVDQQTPAARLAASRSTWQRIKQSSVVGVSLFLQRIVCATASLAVQRKTAVDLGSGVTVTFSNVPGPDVPVYVAGKRVSALHMIYPNLIPQVGIISVGGAMNICLSMRRDPEIDVRPVMTAYFEQELADMCSAFNVAPES
jgi:hypothetical protein